jgi:AcrR family transcriptional regulator
MPAGRPREFDVDKAMERALEVFWRHGYEGATLPALTEAMGINRPSLYGAFGSKEELFRKCLDRYTCAQGDSMARALDRPTAREAVESLLVATINLLTTAGRPRGCLLVQGALACGEAAESVRLELESRRAAGLEAIRKRLDQGKRDGDLPPAADCAALALFVTALMQGFSIQAAGGASRKALLRAAEIAMNGWPE